MKFYKIKPVSVFVLVMDNHVKFPHLSFFLKMYFSFQLSHENSMSKLF